MRKRSFSIVVGILALLAPASGSAIELAHGMEHEHEAVAHSLPHDLTSSVDEPSSVPAHDSLHVSAGSTRLSSATSDAAQLPPAFAFARAARLQAEFPPGFLIEASPPLQFVIRPRAPPAS